MTTSPAPSYEFKGVQVTASSVTVHSKTYFLANISSIGVEKMVVPATTETKFDGLQSPFALGLAVVLFVAGFVIAWMLGSDAGEASAIAALPMLGGLVALAFAFRIKSVVTIPESAIYSIVFDTNSGRIAAYSTRSYTEAQEIKAAVEAAVASAR